MRDQRWLSLARKIAGWKDYKGMCAVITVNDQLVALYQRPEALENKHDMTPNGTAYLWGCEYLEFKLTTMERIVVPNHPDCYLINTTAQIDEVDLGQ